jgi:pimeloyl-ACP methyl ester carboxylesterase
MPTPRLTRVRNALSANSIDGWDSNVPILFVHGTADDYVMPELSVRMHDAMTEPVAVR